VATRAIVTSQPDVACDVCGRRLLRGEHPDTYLAGVERRTVCELCAPRAVQEGWLRESDGHDLSMRPARRRRGVSLLGRLRQLREPVRPAQLTEGDAVEDPAEWEPALYEVEAPFGSAQDDGGSDVSDAARALEAFNAGSQPRRVAGVMRSLGSPVVAVRPLEGSRFGIVIAWELCWYRYEVDVDDELADALLVEKGMELDELAAEDSVANATADERGELQLLA
jgi:hypothetical protein